MLKEMKFTKLGFTEYSLILANLIPVIGIIFFKWQLSTLIIIYWLEMLLVSLFFVLKMIINSIYIRDKFGVFFGKMLVMFMALTVILVLNLFLSLMLIIFASSEANFSPFEGIREEVTAALFFFFISHTLSFFINFIGKGEYKTWDGVKLGSKSQEELRKDKIKYGPFSRVMILTFVNVILFVILVISSFLSGAFFGIVTNNVPTRQIFGTYSIFVISIVYVISKTWIDLYLHKGSHSIKKS